MKKSIVLFSLLAASLHTQAQSKWSIGAETGCVTNVAKFQSGNEEANALFKNDYFETAQLGLTMRYAFCERMSFQTGVRVTQIGFSYSMAKDYSLLDFCKKDDNLKSSGTMVSIPAMMVLHTPFNCLNARFIFGLGASARFLSNQWDTDKQAPITASEGNNTTNSYLTHRSETAAIISPSVNWMVGVERVLAKGNILRFSFQACQGLTTVAESQVNYVANNKNYNHSFINRGSTASFSLGYFFQPIGSKRALKN